MVLGYLPPSKIAPNPKPNPKPNPNPNRAAIFLGAIVQIPSETFLSIPDVPQDSIY